QTFRKDPVFRKLGEVAQYAALNDEDKRAYNKSLKAYRDAYAIYETERAEGRAEGRAAAIAEKTRLAREIGVSEDIIAKLFGSEMNN
ncbi:MAG: Rpn family recombination-promoting nuclease/putative transposase, partial [Muribaculaceae bacterium]|nr:Rpn family recombination-promoting nuclease/putative transposase [Muribaculaceae bacterium]